MGAFQSDAFQNSPNLAFQIGGAAALIVGSSISGGYWSKGKWHALKKQVAEERAQEALEAKQERVAERKERALTPLERAERDFNLAVAYCESCEKKFTSNPVRAVYDELNVATAKANKLSDIVKRLRDERDRDRKANEEAENKRVAKAKEAAQRAIEKKANDIALDRIRSEHASRVVAAANKIKITEAAARQVELFARKVGFKKPAEPPPKPRNLSYQELADYYASDGFWETVEEWLTKSH